LAQPEFLDLVSTAKKESEQSPSWFQWNNKI
jgi:hypothetical protein